MCSFLYLGVPVAHAASIATERLPRIGPASEPDVARLFTAAFAQFVITDGGCSCPLYGSPQRADAQQKQLATRRKRYERMGWSAEKIARALGDSANTRSGGHGEHAGLRQDVAEYIATVAERTGAARMLVRWEGGAADENVAVTNTVRLTAGDLRSHGRTTIAYDTLYVIET